MQFVDVIENKRAVVGLLGYNVNGVQTLVLVVIKEMIGSNCTSPAQSSDPGGWELWKIGNDLTCICWLLSN